MENISCCGTICNKCKDYRKSCLGCNEANGKVTWTRYVGLDICPLYKCAILEKKLMSCSECDEIPCRKWFATKDPTMTDEEFRINIDKRVRVLKGE